jgi:antitoxin YefM
MTTLPLSAAKAQLARLLTEVDDLGERVVITRSGRPVGVLLSVDEYEGLMETLDILSDPELCRAIQAGLEDAAQGRLLSHEEVWSGMDDPVHR